MVFYRPVQYLTYICCGILANTILSILQGEFFLFLKGNCSHLTKHFFFYFKLRDMGVDSAYRVIKQTQILFEFISQFLLTLLANLKGICLSYFRPLQIANLNPLLISCPLIHVKKKKVIDQPSSTSKERSSHKSIPLFSELLC